MRIVKASEVDPAKNCRVNLEEMSFRRGFVHAVFAAVEAVESGATRKQLSDWAWRCQEWRLKYASQVDTQHIPPSAFLARVKRRVVDSERWHVMRRDRETCVYCGWSQGRSCGMPATIHIDHIVPFSRGGESTRENLVCSCSRCNLYKRDRTPEEAGLQIKFLQNGVSYKRGMIIEFREEVQQ